MAGKWIIENKSIPPVAFEALLPIAPPNIQEKVAFLMEVKKKQNEKYLHPKEQEITDFLGQTMLFNQEHAVGLKSGKKMGAEIDAFFFELIR